jgi:hypothetical protein
MKLNLNEIEMNDDQSFSHFYHLKGVNVRIYWKIWIGGGGNSKYVKFEIAL